MKDNEIHQLNSTVSAEEWRPIEGSKGYEISSMGRCRHGEKILRPLDLKTSDWSHYKGYGIRMIGRTRTMFQYAHRLVAEAFYTKIPEKWQINHINGNKHDNRVENLEIVTCRDNNLHKNWMITSDRAISSAIAMVGPELYEAKIRTNEEIISLGRFSSRLDCMSVINEWMKENDVNPRQWYYFSGKHVPTVKEARLLMRENAAG